MINSIVFIIGERASTNKHLALFNSLGQKLLPFYGSISVCCGIPVQQRSWTLGRHWGSLKVVFMGHTMLSSGLSEGRKHCGSSSLMR